MKIYVTNLKGFDQRRRWMTKHLKKLDLQFEFIDCIDGRNWTDEDVKKIISPRLYEMYKRHAKWLTRGGIAATKTHLEKIFQRMLDENDKYVLCLEDDIYLSENFKSILSEMEITLEENNFEGVLLLHYYLNQPTELANLKSFKSDNYSFYMLNPGLTIVSAAAYIITKSAAKGLLKSQSPIDRIGDWWADHPNLNVSFLYPSPVQTGMFASTMGYTYRSRLEKFLFSLTPEYLKRILRMRRLKKKQVANII